MKGRVGSIIVVVWCLAATGACLWLIGDLASEPDDGTDAAGMLIMSCVFIGLVSFVSAVMLSVRLLVQVVRHRRQIGQQAGAGNSD